MSSVFPHAWRAHAQPASVAQRVALTVVRVLPSFLPCGVRPCVRASVRPCARAPVHPCIRASILACVCASVRPLSPARFSRDLPTLQTQVDRPCCVAVLPPSRCCPKAVCPGRAQPESRVCVRGLAYARADARRMQHCGAGRGASNALARGTLRAPGVVLGSQTWRLWCGWGAQVCVGLTHAMTRDGAQNREKKRRRPSP